MVSSRLVMESDVALPAPLRAVLLQRLEVKPDTPALLPALGQRLLVLVGHRGRLRLTGAFDSAADALGLT